MPSSAKRQWCQVSEKNPRASPWRAGASRITSGIASRSAIMGRASLQLSLRQFEQHATQLGLAETARMATQRVGIDQAHPERDLLGATYQEPLPRLDGLHERRGLQKTVGRAGVEPGIAAREPLDLERAFFKKHPVEIRDFELSPAGWTDLPGDIAHPRVI